LLDNAEILIMRRISITAHAEVLTKSTIMLIDSTLVLMMKRKSRMNHAEA
jgi:hypothetical protein